MVTSFRAGLREHLVNAAGPLVNERVYPGRLPDKPMLPAVVYQVITNVAVFAYEGPIPLRNPRIQIDIWSQRAAEAEQIALAVVEATLGYRGPMGDVGYTAGWRLEDETDIYETETGFYRTSLDFRGWYGQQEGGS